MRSDRETEARKSQPVQAGVHEQNQRLVGAWPGVGAWTSWGAAPHPGSRASAFARFAVSAIDRRCTPRRLQAQRICAFERLAHSVLDGRAYPIKLPLVMCPHKKRSGGPRVCASLSQSIFSITITIEIWDSASPCKSFTFAFGRRRPLRQEGADKLDVVRDETRQPPYRRRTKAVGLKLSSLGA